MLTHQSFLSFNVPLRANRTSVSMLCPQEAGFLFLRRGFSTSISFRTLWYEPSTKAAARHSQQQLLVCCTSVVPQVRLAQSWARDSSIKQWLMCSALQNLMYHAEHSLDSMAKETAMSAVAGVACCSRCSCWRPESSKQGEGQTASLL